MRVVIASDDQRHLEFLQSFLWDRGHEAEIATDARECLAVLRAFSPNVLVLERDLFWGGGEAVLRQLRSDPAFAEIAVILVGEEERSDWQMAGDLPPVVARLRSPLRLNELVEEIDALKQRTANTSLSIASKVRRPVPIQLGTQPAQIR